MNKRLYITGFILILTAVACGSITGMFLFMVRDLPQIRSLETFTPPAITRIYSADNTLLAEIYREKRDPVPLKKIPEYLQKAVITAEDRQFYTHSGIDLKGIARAIITDIRAGEFVQGASTITQQLSKTLFLSPQKTLQRKLKEALLSIQLERRYTKDEILKLYLNQIYLGSGAYGVESAARIFFGKSVTDLDLAECAMIAAMPKAPSTYSPLVNPELAVKRRNIVLKQMRVTGVITDDPYREAAEKPFVAVQNKTVSKAPYFVDYVKKILEKEIGPARLYTGGLTVYTTLSSKLQNASDQAIVHGIENLQQRRKKDPALKTEPQGALIAIDVRTGGILAMSGGNDYSKSSFNRSTAARRQSGSAFKPVLYAHAIEQGFNQASLILDAPVSFPGATKNEPWQPENFSKTFQGEITLRKALTHSENIPAVRLIDQLGISSVIDFARKLGIQSRLSPYLSLALGTSETNLTELTAAYAVFANQGIYIHPYCIVDVLNADNQSVWKPNIEKRIAMTRENAAIMSNMLEGVIAEGTGKKAQVIHRSIAGKTGTTNKYKDALFVGFSPTIAVGVWVGCDDFSTLGLKETGARAALPIWVEFMKNALKNQEYGYFDVPDNMVKLKINPTTGKPVPNGQTDDQTEDSDGVVALFAKENSPE
ncbi:MAG: PBP1A family penicillin-binding protein [Desulfobacteraceae bacterium]|nr:PBP1A family penicillin-binding protein [Desulfobacteraceae bacterium]MBC2754049.1 PBP1A family penicillin-binding protein [Desulfobacteraceae bacterium]